MEKTTTQNSTLGRLSSEQLKAQLANHLEAQPENIRSFHRIMRIIEYISFGLMIIIFITALVLSFMWKSIPVATIPTAWMLLPVSAAILTLLIGVHVLFLHAYPPSNFLTIFKYGSPIRLPGISQGFVSGKKADLNAWGLIIGGLVVGAFFSVFAWAIWTVNWAILTPMITVLGVLLGVGIAISILFSIVQKILKTH
jgi:hypothetical protein